MGWVLQCGRSVLILGMSVSTSQSCTWCSAWSGIASGVLVLLRPSASPKASGPERCCSSRHARRQHHRPALPSGVPALWSGHGIGVASLVGRRADPCWRSGATGWPARGARPTFAVPRPCSTSSLHRRDAAFAKIGFLSALPATSLGSPLLLAHLLVLATSVWLAIHAFAYLQLAGASRRIRARALRVADRWKLRNNARPPNGLDRRCRAEGENGVKGIAPRPHSIVVALSQLRPPTQPLGSAGSGHRR